MCRRESGGNSLGRDLGDGGVSGRTVSNRISRIKFAERRSNVSRDLERQLLRDVHGCLFRGLQGKRRIGYSFASPVQNASGDAGFNLGFDKRFIYFHNLLSTICGAVQTRQLKRFERLIGGRAEIFKRRKRSAHSGSLSFPAAQKESAGAITAQCTEYYR